MSGLSDTERETLRESIAKQIEAQFLGPDYGRQHDGRDSPHAAETNAYDEGLWTAARIVRGLDPEIQTPMPNLAAREQAATLAERERLLGRLTDPDLIEAMVHRHFDARLDSLLSNPTSQMRAALDVLIAQEWETLGDHPDPAEVMADIAQRRADS